MSSIVELAGVTCKADGPDVISEVNGAAELHEGDVIVEQGVVPVRMDDDLGHLSAHLINIWPTLSLSSKENSPGCSCVAKRRNDENSQKV